MTEPRVFNEAQQDLLHFMSQRAGDFLRARGDDPGLADLIAGRGDDEVIAMLQVLHLGVRGWLDGLQWMADEANREHLGALLSRMGWDDLIWWPAPDHLEGDGPAQP